MFVHNATIPFIPPKVMLSLFSLNRATVSSLHPLCKCVFTNFPPCYSSHHTGLSTVSMEPDVLHCLSGSVLLYLFSSLGIDISVCVQ